MIDGTVIFAAVTDRVDLALESRITYERLPAVYQAVLRTTNGLRVGPKAVSFFTSIPFEDPTALLPSKTDSIVALLGVPTEDEVADYYSIDEVAREWEALLPREALPFARTTNGLVCFSLREADYGSVWYHSIFPRDAAYFERHAQESEAGAFRQWLLLAADYEAFLDHCIIKRGAPRDFGVLETFDVQQYAVTTEQTMRMAAIHNIYVMLDGAEPTAEQQALIDSIATQLLDSDYLETAQAAAESMMLLHAEGAENVILEWMIDCLMFDAEHDPWKVDVCSFYAAQVGVSQLHLHELISDYRGVQTWKATRPAPSLSELMALGRTETLRLVQLLYLIAIADGGDITAEQDALIVQHAHSASLKPQELQFIINRKATLPLPSVQSETQQAQWVSTLGQLLSVGRAAVDAEEYAAAAAWCQAQNIPLEALDQAIHVEQISKQG